LLLYLLLEKGRCLPIGAVFHDLGLTKKFSSPDKRFEVDGANAARSFLEQQGISKAKIQIVWDAIALHTTIGVAQYKEPEVFLVYLGYDVHPRLCHAKWPLRNNRTIINE